MTLNSKKIIHTRKPKDNDDHSLNWFEYPDPVTEQFVSANRGQMKIPKTTLSIPRFIYRLFTKIERIMFNKKPSKKLN